MASNESTQLDGCPECMTRNNIPLTSEALDHGTRCHYQCRVCGCTWYTAWLGA